MGECVAVHRARRARLLGAARLSSLRRPLARTALFERLTCDAVAERCYRPHRDALTTRQKLLFSPGGADRLPTWSARSAPADRLGWLSRPTQLLDRFRARAFRGRGGRARY